MSSCAASSSYASATGTPTSYARIHGEVSRAPAAWRRISTVAKEELTDVFYDKAEGIAKVTECQNTRVVTLSQPQPRN